MSSCKENEGIIPAVNIEAALPSMGLIGDTIIISGNNFSVTSTKNLVSFNDVLATVISSTETEIKTFVPYNSTSGKIKVSVNGIQSTGNVDFEVLKDIPRSGLVAFYPFNSNANDTGGKLLHGDVFGANLTLDRFGLENKAYRFDGQDDYITMGNPAALQIHYTMTIGLWVKVSDGYTVRQRIISKAAVPINYSYGYGFDLNLDKTYDGVMLTGAYVYYSLPDETGVITSGVTGYLFTETLGLSPGLAEWTFVTLILNGNQMKFYINGVITFEGGIFKSLDNCCGDFTVGASGYQMVDFFNGEVDDITIYDRVLSENEVHQLYEQTVSKK
jgi:hypothetical protein